MQLVYAPEGLLEHCSSSNGRSIITVSLGAVSFKYSVSRACEHCSCGDDCVVIGGDIECSLSLGERSPPDLELTVDILLNTTTNPTIISYFKFDMGREMSAADCTAMADAVHDKKYVGFGRNNISNGHTEFNVSEGYVNIAVAKYSDGIWITNKVPANEEWFRQCAWLTDEWVNHPGKISDEIFRSNTM
jgi:hypothetical protein